MRNIKFQVIQENKIIGEIGTDPHFNDGAWFWIDYSLPEDDRILDCCLDNLFPKNVKPFSCLTYRQYTGLKDKNGVEIYEGDILGADDRWFKILVGFDDGAFTLDNLGGNKSLKKYLDDQEEDFLVIGNIYENKELMDAQTSHV